MDALRKAKMGSGSDEESGPKSGPVATSEGEDDGEGGLFDEAVGKVANVLKVKESDRPAFADALKAAIYACMEE